MEKAGTLTLQIADFTAFIAKMPHTFALEHRFLRRKHTTIYLPYCVHEKTDNPNREFNRDTRYALNKLFLDLTQSLCSDVNELSTWYDHDARIRRYKMLLNDKEPTFKLIPYQYSHKYPVSEFFIGLDDHSFCQTPYSGTDTRLHLIPNAGVDVWYMQLDWQSKIDDPGRDYEDLYLRWLEDPSFLD